MRSIVSLALLCGACASQAPTQLDQIKQAVDTRASYTYYTGWDKRVLQAGDKGNCAAFAFTYQNEAAKHHIPVMVKACMLKNGQGHAVGITADGWVLDIRERWVVRAEDAECLPGVNRDKAAELMPRPEMN